MPSAYRFSICLSSVSLKAATCEQPAEWSALLPELEAEAEPAQLLWLPLPLREETAEESLEVSRAWPFGRGVCRSSLPVPLRWLEREASTLARPFLVGEEELVRLWDCRSVCLGVPGIVIGQTEAGSDRIC